MSDAAAGAAFVVEQVLLYDASLLTIGRKRVAAAEFLINESLYPKSTRRLPIRILVPDGFVVLLESAWRWLLSLS